MKAAPYIWLIISLISCSNPKNSIDISAFYYPLSKIETQKVYHYQTSATDDQGTTMSSTFYVEIKRLNKHDFSFRVLNADFYPTDSSTLELVDDGVKIRAKYVQTEHGWIKEEISGCEYVHQNFRQIGDICGANYLSTTPDGAKQDVLIETTFKGNELMTSSYTGEINACKIELFERTRIDYSNQEHSISQTSTLIYIGENIGIVKMEVDGTGFSATTNLINVSEVPVGSGARNGM